MALRLEYPEVSLLLYEAQGASLSSFSTHCETWYSFCIYLYFLVTYWIVLLLKIKKL